MSPRRDGSPTNSFDPARDEPAWHRVVALRWLCLWAALTVSPGCSSNQEPSVVEVRVAPPPATLASGERSPSLAGRSMVIEIERFDPRLRNPAECPSDGRRKALVDLERAHLELWACAASGQPLLTSRALHEAEVDAFRVLAERALALPVGTCQKGSQERLMIRGERGERVWECAAELELIDLLDLVHGLTLPDEATCGGPRGRPCPSGRCGARDGVVPYAFGRCELEGTGGIGCAAMVSCGRGWRPTGHCPPRARCRYHNLGCGDPEVLCVRCEPGEDCPPG